MSHLNIGRVQILWWPRWRLCFWRGGGEWYSSIYRCVLYVWPLEFRLFRKALREVRPIVGGINDSA